MFFSPSDALSLSLSGEFRIPTSIPTELIVDFLGKHKQKAMDLHEENKKNILTEEQAVQSCKEKFQFSSLSKDSSVSPMQMSDCCERLLEEDYPDLKNTTLIVSKYYHVNEDGQISIPWNWK